MFVYLEKAYDRVPRELIYGTRSDEMMFQRPHHEQCRKDQRDRN